MNKSARTRRFIIEKTAPIFNKYGFEGTSLSLLQDATGLTKGSLYGNFADKEEIAREAFLYSMEKVREVVHARLEKQKTAKQKLVALMKFYSDYVFNPVIAGGCPLLNNAVEADDHHTSLKKSVASEISRTIEFITSLLERGCAEKEFRADIDCRALAITMFTAIEGAIMVSRVMSSDTVMKIVVRSHKKILDSITI